jgi:hypothetical protein
MAIRSEEDRQMATRVLSAINYLQRAGATDAMVSGNSTVTALANAVQALSFGSSGHPDLSNQVAKGLRQGAICGAISETHGQSTIAGLRNLVAAQIPEVASDYDANLPQ